MAPIPADSSGCCETGGSGAATATPMLFMDADSLAWPSDADMTVLRVKARGQSILGDGGHLCWPSPPVIPRSLRVQPAATLPSSGEIGQSGNTASLVNLAAPSPRAAPDGEALLMPCSSWSAKSVNLSDMVYLPPATPIASPRSRSPRCLTDVDNLAQVDLRKIAETQADFSRPATPRPRSWRDIFSQLCCGGGSDSR